MESIADQSLGALASAIASREPSPGAGVAAAATLALGIACARKAAAITLKHDPDRRGLAAADARLEERQQAALRLADIDARCFLATIRHDEAAASRLIEGDEELLACAAEAQQDVSALSALVDTSMRNDVVAARTLIEAATTIVRANLGENQAAQSSRSSRSDADR